MTFWDSSAIIPLLVDESGTAMRQEQYESGGTIAVWWGTIVECTSAIQKVARHRGLSPAQVAKATSRLTELRSEWIEIEPSADIRRGAMRLVRTHPLSAADALQLAAAIALSAGDPSRLPILAGDNRLRAAAEIEGFEVHA